MTFRFTLEALVNCNSSLVKNELMFKLKWIDFHLFLVNGKCISKRQNIQGQLFF